MTKRNNSFNNSFSYKFIKGNVNNASFPLQKMASYYLVPLEITLVLVGAVASSIVLLKFFKGRKLSMRKPSSMLLFHQCFTDFLVIAITAVGCSLKMFGIKDSCPIAFACYIFSQYASIFTLVILSFERNKSFTKPFERRMRNSKAFCYIFVSWIVTFACSTPLFVTTLNLVPRSCISGRMDRTSRLIYFSWLLLSQYVIPLAIIASLNIHTYLYTKANALSCTKNVQLHSSSTINTKGSRSIKTSKVFRTLFYMTINFALCMMPQHILLIYQEFNSVNLSASPELNETIIHAAFFDMVFLNAVLNFFLYGAVNRSFKCHLSLTWICCLPSKNEREKINNRKDKTVKQGVYLTQFAKPNLLFLD